MRLAVMAAGDSWYWRDLLRAAEDRHELLRVTYRTLQAEWLADNREPTVSSEGINLGDCDALLVRTMPPGSLEQIITRMNLLAALTERIPVINPPRAIEVAVDKGLCTARLAAAGLPTPRTLITQTVEQAIDAMSLFPSGVVAKPLFGSEGRGIAHFTDPAVAERAFQLWTHAGAVLYLQEYIPHRNMDYRVFFVADRHWVMRRYHPDDWRTNLSRGATGEACKIPVEWIDVARRAAQAVGAPLAGVDLLQSEAGDLYVIEVNAVPGWRGIGQVLQVDFAKEVLNYLAGLIR